MGLVAFVSGTFDLAYAFLLARDRFHYNNLRVVTQESSRRSREINTSVLESELRIVYYTTQGAARSVARLYYFDRRPYNIYHRKLRIISLKQFCFLCAINFCRSCP